MFVGLLTQKGPHCLERQVEENSPAETFSPTNAPTMAGFLCGIRGLNVGTLRLGLVLVFFRSASLSF